MKRPKISDYTKDLLASYDQLSELSCDQDKYTDQLEAERKWISVKDRLPEKQGYYLVWCPQSFPKNWPGVVAEFYEDNGLFYDEAFEDPIEDATHWQKLSEPPK